MANGFDPGDAYAGLLMAMQQESERLYIQHQFKRAFETICQAYNMYHAQRRSLDRTQGPLIQQIRYQLVITLKELGEYTEMIRFCKQEVPSNLPYGKALTALAYAALGQSRNACKWAQEAVDLYKSCTHFYPFDHHLREFVNLFLLKMAEVQQSEQNAIMDETEKRVEKARKAFEDAEELYSKKQYQRTLDAVTQCEHLVMSDRSSIHQALGTDLDMRLVLLRAKAFYRQSSLDFTLHDKVDTIVQFCDTVADKQKGLDLHLEALKVKVTVLAQCRGCQCALEVVSCASGLFKDRKVFDALKKDLQARQQDAVKQLIKTWPLVTGSTEKDTLDSLCCALKTCVDTFTLIQDSQSHTEQLVILQPPYDHPYAIMCLAHLYFEQCLTERQKANWNKVITTCHRYPNGSAKVELLAAKALLKMGRREDAMTIIKGIGKHGGMAATQEQEVKKCQKLCQGRGDERWLQGDMGYTRPSLIPREKKRRASLSKMPEDPATIAAASMRSRKRSSSANRAVPRRSCESPKPTSKTKSKVPNIKQNILPNKFPNPPSVASQAQVNHQPNGAEQKPVNRRRRRSGSLSTSEDGWTTVTESPQRSATPTIKPVPKPTAAKDKAGKQKPSQPKAGASKPMATGAGAQVPDRGSSPTKPNTFGGQFKKPHYTQTCLFSTLEELSSQYSTRLACEKCYAYYYSKKVHPQYNVNSKHSCKQEYLIVKDKTGTGHRWQKIRACMAPYHVTYFIQCKHIENNCFVRESCKFYHSLEEKDFWECERTGLVSVDQIKAQKSTDPLAALVTIQKKDLEKLLPPPTTSNAGSGKTWSQAATGSTGTTFEICQGQAPKHYCDICDVSCNSEVQLQNHLASKKHMTEMQRDEGTNWLYRRPPKRVTKEIDLALCDENKNGYCWFGDMCIKAHGEAELDEWKIRLQGRQEKKQRAKEMKNYSYMEDLMERMEDPSTRSQLVTRDRQNVIITCDSHDTETVYLEKGGSHYTWTFTICTQADMPLTKAALLSHQGRTQFHIEVSRERLQLISGQMCLRKENQGTQEYQIKVVFKGGLLGSFRQWLIFDFGSEPKVIRELSVEVGSEETLACLKQLHQQIQFDHWSSDTHDIVPYRGEGKNTEDDWVAELLEKYNPERSSVDQTLLAELTSHNYISQMHSFLYAEEKARHKIISHYNLRTKMEVMQTVTEESMDLFQIAPQGQMFAKVVLEHVLTEDTEAGTLVLENCTRALLRKAGTEDTKVYEALVCTKHTIGFEGHQRDYVYLCLSTECVEEMALTSGSATEVEVQFEMDRQPFCKWHFALDKLKDSPVVKRIVPDKVNPMSMHDNPNKFDIRQSGLKPNQRKVVDYIINGSPKGTPPLVVYGPFGTGKTRTLAEAAVALIKCRPECRILICTRSNSAADLYIENYFHKQKEEGASLKVRRVYSKFRKPTTMSEIARGYGQWSSEENCFLTPKVEDLKEHQIIITTLTMSVELLHLDCRGLFTHIFIDEAAQTLEVEAIMPLALADNETCIILAGDHKQIGPQVFHEFARKKNLHHSLLQRLYCWYSQKGATSAAKKDWKLLLNHNFRSHPTILEFISRVFYGHEESLSHCSKNQESRLLPAMEFHPVLGQEMTPEGSTSCCNPVEASAVADYVEYLVAFWRGGHLPEWGDYDPAQIAVIAPYTAQVTLIREKLREKKLRQVTVYPITMVQGKEYRALFLSIVRTTQAKPNMPFLGFLTDDKLLNAAVTRVKSYIAAVGDPYAMCNIGACSTIWQNYIDSCPNAEVPEEVVSDNTAEFLRQISSTSQPQTPEPVSTPLDPLATPFFMDNKTKENKNQNKTGLDMGAQGSPSKQTLNIPVINGGKTFSKSSTSNRAQNVPCSMSKKASDKPQERSGSASNVKSSSKEIATAALNNRAVSVEEEADQIIEELVRQSMDGDTSEPDNRTDDKIFIECIRVEEAEYGHVKLVYDKDWAKKGKERRRRLMNAAMLEEEYDSSKDALKLQQEYEAEKRKYEQYSPEKLQKLVTESPNKYKRATMRVESYSHMYAKLEPQESSFTTVVINGIKRRGRAFDGDEVVVEVFDHKDEEEVHGRVIGILKSNYNPKMKKFICMVDWDGHNCGVLNPVDKTIPKIQNITMKRAKPQKGHVMVYNLLADGKTHQLNYHHKIDQTNPNSHLFVMRYLEWNPTWTYPTGMVVDVIEAGDNIDSGMYMLNVEHEIPEEYSRDCKEEVREQYPSNFSLSEKMMRARTDLRQSLIFTIDGVESRDLDDALSIEKISEDKYKVGVHISDASHFIPFHGALDAEAYERTTSIYPAKGPVIHMIPGRLSTNLCSLLPNEDRLTLSVFFEIDKDGKVISATKPMKTVINSKCKLVHQQVEAILDPTMSTGEPLPAIEGLKENLKTLSKLAQIMRERRLGSRYFNFDSSEDHADAPLTHDLVEEYMVLTNKTVSEYLCETFPGCTPLRRQLPPSEMDLESWRNKHGDTARGSFGLRQPLQRPKETCTCIGACTCVPGQTSDMLVMKESWEKLVTAINSGNMLAVQQVVGDMTSYPQQMVALRHWHQIQERSAYVCSGDMVHEMDGQHYSLQIERYTHFTSPIRRYIDIVVHRQVHAMIDKKQNPYTIEEIKDICLRCTEKSQKANHYEKASAILHAAVSLKDQPQTMYGVVTEPEDKGLRITLHNQEKIKPARDRININHLEVSRKPQLTEQVSLRLTWEMRVYDYDWKDKTEPGFTSKAQNPNMAKTAKELNPNQLVHKLPANHWENLLRAVQNGDFYQMQTLQKMLEPEIQQEERQTRYLHDVISEVPPPDKLTKKTHYSRFTLDIQACSILNLQLSASLYRGMIQPTIQLVHLTGTIDICMEHNSSPVECFSHISTVQAARLNYKTEEEYKSAWLPVLSMEAAYEAVDDGEVALVHNVQVTWLREYGSGEIKGKFSMLNDYCQRRYLQFKPGDYFCIRWKEHQSSPTWIAHCIIGRGSSKNEDDSDESDDSDWYSEEGEEEEDEMEIDEVCVKDMQNIGKQEMEEAGKTELRERKIRRKRGKKKEKEKEVTVKFWVNHMAHPLPDAAFKRPLPCTIQVIGKSISSRRMENAVQRCDKSSNLARNIALGKKPPALPVLEEGQPDVNDMEVPGFDQANPSQASAVRMALTEPFTLIQGPPGTGKTVTGARLAYLFTKANREKPFDKKTINGKTHSVRAQLMYCGPSNKSVDVVAEKMMEKMKKDVPKLLRIYGKKVERRDFPLPDEPVSSKHKESTTEAMSNERLRDITLHFRIRKNTNPHHEKILEFDEAFRTKKPEDISLDDITEYIKCVTKASKWEIMQAEIILCTCSTAADVKIKELSNIKQLIIDECGMCTEPESMVPIVASKAPQVVLIGDHKQLQPIIKCKRAVQAGLNVSMFQRYADMQSVQMLTMQYRMHEAIMAFPSKEFYDGRLKCGLPMIQNFPSDMNIWPDRTKPIVFCHVEGNEKSLPVSSSEGGVESMSNAREAERVANYAKLLIMRYRKREEHICILSPYRSQCTDIRKKLEENAIPSGVQVLTVVKSQGSEWDYVILSCVRSQTIPEQTITPGPRWFAQNLGIVCDPHQINVAITRAKRGLIIVGNTKLLSYDPVWKNLISHFRENNCVVDAYDFMGYRDS